MTGRCVNNEVKWQRYSSFDFFNIWFSKFSSVLPDRLCDFKLVGTRTDLTDNNNRDLSQNVENYCLTQQKKKKYIWRIKTAKSGSARASELVIGYGSRWIDLFVAASFFYLSLTREEARVPRFTKLIQSVIGYKLTKLVSFNPDTEYQNDIVKIRMNQNDEKKNLKSWKR